MKTLKIILILIVFAGVAPTLFSEDKETLTVMDFKTSNLEEAEMQVFIDYISSHIVSTDLYRVIDREQRKTILDELNFAYSGMADEKTQLEIGKALAANKIILGSLGLIGDRYLLNIKLVDVETGETLESASKAYASINDLIDNSQLLTYTLLNIEGTSGTASGDGKDTSDDVTDTVTTTDKTIVKKDFPRHTIEILAGYAISDRPNISISAAYMFSITKNFLIGAWGGYLVKGENSLPLVGIKTVLGNKFDGLAFGINLGLFPGVSLYFRNFSLAVSPSFLISTSNKVFIEVGYGFSF